MVPPWLHILSILSVVAGFLTAAIVLTDEVAHPQKMWIMNVVWPVTALFGSGLALWGYCRHGRGADHAHKPHHGKSADPAATDPVTVGKASTHCGSGCTLGDLIAEWLVFFFPVVAVWFGWKVLFAEKMFAVWIVDFVFAFAFGIVFQYFTIAPMRNLGVRDGILAAVKADTLSLVAWQVGMYGFMAIAQFLLFRRLLGVPLEVASFEFWFMMQIAMCAGFLTSYPVNWWLLRAGIKEPM